MDKYLTPEEIYGELFYEIHRNKIFADGKVFADARAKMSPTIILKEYNNQKHNKDFNLSQFVNSYFDTNQHQSISYTSEDKDITNHISDLWQHLKRDPDKRKNKDSRIPLPYDYIVPGGRFNEIYYWDSYFTILGLKVSNEIDTIENMVNNFRHMIHTFGHIPNGNRTYFLSRSQPPFFSLMVKTLIQEKGQQIVKDYLPSLVGEYNFWMKGTDHLDKSSYNQRVVKIDASYLLNRYYDQKDTPREEMYRDDWKMINFDDNRSRPLFRHIRAACESGWDFSSRWMKDPSDLTTLQTLDILPIDLNCLLWHLEKLISECYKIIGKDELSLNYGILSVNRKNAIQKLFWNKESEFYCDYNFKEEKISNHLTLAGMFPLFFKLASENEAKASADKIKSEFLKDGGVVTSLVNSGQQWDSPNGWAPLQYITIMGLLNYGYKSLAQEIAHRWTQLNERTYKETGKMLEKYNVLDTSLKGAGGEYDLQDGFGWTNGVYLALTS